MDKNTALTNLLEPGERVLWSGAPEPWKLTASSFMLYVFAVPWTIFTSGWLWLTTDGLKWLPPAIGIYPAWTPRFYFFSSLLLVLPGVVMLTAPWWAWRKARRLFYAVTDRRVLQLDTAKPGRAESLPLEGGLTVKVAAGDEDDEARDVDFIDAKGKGMRLRAVPEPERIQVALGV